MSPDSGLRAVEAAFGVEAFPFPDRETDKANAVTKLPNPDQCLTQPEIRFRCDGGGGGGGMGSWQEVRRPPFGPVGSGPPQPCPNCRSLPAQNSRNPKIHRVILGLKLFDKYSNGASPAPEVA